MTITISTFLFTISFILFLLMLFSQLDVSLRDRKSPLSNTRLVLEEAKVFVNTVLMTVTFLVATILDSDASITKSSAQTIVLSSICFAIFVMAIFILGIAFWNRTIYKKRSS